jgi:hypothetical protein
VLDVHLFCEDLIAGAGAVIDVLAADVEVGAGVGGMGVLCHDEEQ